ncbi:MAG: amidohydrolase family protein [Planctomycetota bacterium]
MSAPNSTPYAPRPLVLPEVFVVEGNTCGLHGLERVRLRIDTRVSTSGGASAGRFIEWVTNTESAADLQLAPHELLLPGFLDLHVHCRDDPSGRERYKEDFATASRAALSGGVVLLGDMPNNAAPPIDSASYEAKQACVHERALVDVILYGGIAPGTRPFAKAIPYKCYYGPSVGNLNLSQAPDASATLAAYHGHFVAFHAEKQSVLDAHRDRPTHESRRPAAAEAEAIRDIARLARAHGFHPHIAHLSSAAGLAEVRSARAAGLAMTCEVAPHHLCFDDENRARFERGAWLQMNPPIRTRQDRLALFEAFASGEIEILATDHAPHSREENARGISGVPHLDTFAAYVSLLHREGLPWSTLIERAAAAPARLFAPFIPHAGRLGALAPGYLASFTVLDTRRPWRVDAQELHTRSGWSPFEGVELPARVVLTSVRGKVWQVAPRS